MTLQPTESGQENGKGVPPAPTISPTSDGKQTSQSGNDSSQLLQRLDQLERFVKDELPEQLSRTAQSRHDKRIGRIESEISTLRTSLEAAGLKGPEVDAALGRMRYNKLEETVEELASGGRTGTAPQPQAESFDESEARAIADAHGVDYDDPKVMAWRNGTFTSVKEARLALINSLVAKPKVTSEPPPPPPASAGTIVMEGGGKPSADAGEQLDTLYARLTELNRAPIANAAERDKVRKRIKELGGEL